MSHSHNSSDKENKSIISFKNSFWLVVILVGLFIASLNFVQAESAPEGEGHGGHEATTHEAHGKAAGHEAKHAEATHEEATHEEAAHEEGAHEEAAHEEAMPAEEKAAH